MLRGPVGYGNESQDGVADVTATEIEVWMSEMLMVQPILTLRG